jgi:outer membrane protein assembly factor BamB
MRLLCFIIVALWFGGLTTTVYAQAPLRLRWSLPTINDVGEENTARAFADNRMEEKESVIPQFRSVVADGRLFMRTPRLVMAVEYETGKRTWEYPWFESQFEAIPRETKGYDYANVQLEDRMWDDAPYASLTVGAGKLFVLDKLGSLPARRRTRRSIITVDRTGRGSAPVWSNELAALDINSQGKLMWLVGGESGGNEPQLAGGFLFSTGCVYKGLLFVVVELEDKLQLAALDPKTGGIEWSLKLGEIEEDDLVKNNPLRRIAAITTVVVGSRLIFPTVLGEVVAVDVEGCKFDWKTSYEHQRTLRDEDGWRVPFPSQGKRWLDNAVLPAGDVVIVTPMDSQQLYCLDVETGEVQWQMDREDRLFAAVEGDICLLIGPKGILARSTRDGTAPWEGRWVVFSDGAMPSGRGVFEGGRYLLPTTKGELLSIDCRNGESSVVAVTESPLGNLLLHDGELISTGYDHVKTFSR